jgi:Bacterial toxin 50
LYEASPSFTEALLNSTRQGAIEAAIEFVPSMCHSAYGLGETLWTTVEHPIESTKEFANVCYEMSECIVDYCKNLDWNTVDGYVEQIKTLYERFDQLSEAEKGQLIGYTVGKYGVDIFAGGAAIKGVVALKKLKNINRVCNLEAMTLSTANKEAIVSSALKHASEREVFLKNVKIHWDKQNKHIPGKHNFEVGKGTILIEPVEFENLVKAYVGTGQKVAGEFGQANYKERVDFGKTIGEYAQQVKGEPTKYYPTSKGIITYAKDGSVHVYPTNPNSTFN